MGQNKEEKWGLEDIRALEHLPGNNFSYKELDAATFIDSLVISYKIEHSIIYYHIIQKLHSLYLLKRAEKLHLHKTLHMDVYSNFIHNFPNLEATKMAFCR